MKYEQLAKDIIENVGGKDNVKSVVHCITRLRFKLQDENKANTDVLKNMEGVITVRQSGGQYQVVIGNHVPEVYKAVVDTGGFEDQDQVPEDDKDKGNLFNRFIDLVAGIFTPILGVLTASGIIKGFNALFIALGVLEEESGVYQLLNATGDALFYFLPILLGYTSMKKFGGSPFLGIVIAMALLYPALEGIPGAEEPLYTLFSGTVFESEVYIEFFGIPVILMSYSMSVIPILLSTFFASKVEKGLVKIIPSGIKMFMVPLLTLLATVPLTFIIIGPIATWASQILGNMTIFIYDLSPMIAGIFIGGFWMIFVMFGLHWGLIPISFNNIAVSGTDPILALILVHSFALAGAILAVWIRTRNQNTKTLSPPALISAIFGITEPGMYGIVLPLKWPFLFTLIASAIGGGIIGYSGTLLYIIGGLGVFQFPSLIHPEEGLNAAFYGAVIAVVIGTVLSFILTYFFGGINKSEGSENKEIDSYERNSKKTGMKSETVFSPLTGAVKSLTSLEDPAFSSGALGQGVAVDPSEGRLVSPVSGEVTVLFPTNHAVGIKTDQGAEVLMHIGMDTVQLEGQYFTGHVEQGQRVEQGQLLVEFDIEKIKGEGYSLVTPLVITNTDDYEEIIIAEENDVSEEQPLIILEAEVKKK